MSDNMCTRMDGTAAANHCWHDTGNVLTSYPAQTQEVCCHCGATRNIRQMVVMNSIDGHGPYAPTGGSWAERVKG